MSREITSYLAGKIECLKVEHAFQKPEEAISYVNSRKTDLAIIDTELDEMDGIDLGYCLREINPELVLVFTSSSEENAMNALKLRAAAYLLKPMNQDELQIFIFESIPIAERKPFESI